MKSIDLILFNAENFLSQLDAYVEARINKTASAILKK